MILTELLSRSEGKTLEFKRDLSSPDKIVKTAVAFANTAGGILLIGVEDRTKRVRGLPDVIESEEKLTNLLSGDNIQPPIAPEIEILPWRRLQVVAAHIHPSNTRPHFVRKLGIEKGVFLRIGSTNRKADSTQIEDLRRFVRQGTFDEQPLAGTNSEDLDFRAASEYFSEYRTLTRESMRTLHLLAKLQGKEVSTVGGMLLFGKDRLSHFPDAWIQAGLFTGRDKSSFAETREIRSYLPGAVHEAIEFLHRHLRRRISIGKVQRTETLEVPEVAIREAVINAVVHADYAQTGAPIRIAVFEDRVEIDNPGMLVFGLTVEDIVRGVSRLRNRVIGRVFQELRLIEQWGSGIQRITAACREVGLGAPVFEEIGTHFRVTLSRKRQNAPEISESDQHLLKLLSLRIGRSTAELAASTGISTRAMRNRLKQLVARGLVVEIGSGPNDPRRRYFRVRDS